MYARRDGATVTGPDGAGDVTDEDDGDWLAFAWCEAAAATLAAAPDTTACAAVEIEEAADADEVPGALCSVGVVVRCVRADSSPSYVPARCGRPPTLRDAEPPNWLQCITLQFNARLMTLLRPHTYSHCTVCTAGTEGGNCGKRPS